MTKITANSPTKSPPTKSHVMPTYNRSALAFVRGQGAWLFTADDTAYLDFAAGIGVNALGHSHPALVDALKQQADSLWHVSNLYTIPGQEKLAARLCDLTFADKIFFCNSGAEAMEGAIKTARKYHAAKASKSETPPYEIISFTGAFHGRTLATLAAAGNPAHLDGFGPKLEGFVHIDGFDIAKTTAAITDKTAAIMIEPIQGEGGMKVVPLEFMQALRALCDAHGLLLIVDEVQCGTGRTGKLFAHEWAGITPDIMAIAKGIGGGFPIGAFLATQEAARGMVAGTHGSTYGGNPLGMAVAGKVLDIVSTPDFLAQVSRMGLALKQQLTALKTRYPELIAEVRGDGLMLGLKCLCPNIEMVEALRTANVLSVGAGDNVVRLMPPLIIGAEEIAALMTAFDKACTALQKTPQRDGQ